jgi:peroxiredoxin
MNKDNKKILSFVVGIIGLVLLGYLLFKTSPKNSTGNSNNLSQNQTSTKENNGGLDSLVGKPLPAIELTDKDGNVVTNESFKGKITVLFFNEGLMCYPACWNQMAMFGSDSRFNTDQIQAMSVLVDPSSDWQKAIDKMPELAKAKALFDVGGTVSRKLGLLTLPSSMHSGLLPGHTYIVLDKMGTVRYVSDDPNMAIANDMLIRKIAEFN